MKRTCRFCWAISALLAIVIAGMAYMFLIRGNVAASDDGRKAIILSAGERDLVLAEMRGFLEAIEAITVAMGEKDMATITDSAHEVGMANVAGVPASLMSKLPLEFRSLGKETHLAFDALAQESEESGDTNIVVGKLGDLLANCTACHASYRFESLSKNS